MRPHAGVPLSGTVRATVSTRNQCRQCARRGQPRWPNSSPCWTASLRIDNKPSRPDQRWRAGHDRTCPRPITEIPGYNARSPRSTRRDRLLANGPHTRRRNADGHRRSACAGGGQTRARLQKPATRSLWHGQTRRLGSRAGWDGWDGWDGWGCRGCRVRYGLAAIHGDGNGRIRGARLWSEVGLEADLCHDANHGQVHRWDDARVRLFA